MASIDWSKPIVFKANDGETIPARLSGLKIKGTGAYIYTKRYLSPLSFAQFGKDDIGISQKYFEPDSGQSIDGIGQIVNAPKDLLDDTIFDPKTGKEYLVPEREARRREQQAATGTKTPAGDPIVKIHVTTERASGAKDMAGSVAV